MNKIGIILFAFLCISIAVAGCSSPSYVKGTPQNPEQQHLEPVVDTSQRVEGSVYYPLYEGKGGFNILVTSDVPVNIYQYGIRDNGESVTWDLDPPANGITYYKKDYFPFLDVGRVGDPRHITLKGIQISTSKKYPVANVHTTITREYWA